MTYREICSKVRDRGSGIVDRGIVDLPQKTPAWNVTYFRVYCELMCLFLFCLKVCEYIKLAALFLKLHEDCNDSYSLRSLQNSRIEVFTFRSVIKTRRKSGQAVAFPHEVFVFVN